MIAMHAWMFFCRICSNLEFLLTELGLMFNYGVVGVGTNFFAFNSLPWDDTDSIVTNLIATNLYWMIFINAFSYSY